MHLNDEVMRELYEPHHGAVTVPYPKKEWEVEDAPEDADEDSAPLIYVHKPSGERFEIEPWILVTPLASPETQARETEIDQGQLEIPDGQREGSEEVGRPGPGSEGPLQPAP